MDICRISPGTYLRIDTAQSIWLRNWSPASPCFCSTPPRRKFQWAMSSSVGFEQSSGMSTNRETQNGQLFASTDRLRPPGSARSAALTNGSECNSSRS